jgi:hypothetical protein
MRRLVLIACLAALATGVAAQSASALVAGIGDQNASTFSDPSFRALHVKRTRLIVAWDAVNSAAGRQRLNQWMAGARAAHLRILVAFNPTAGSRCPSRPCSLPSSSRYTKAFKAFRKRWPSIRIVSPWNEANHRSQPTFNNPKRAAQYYKVVKRYCRGCTIVAADVIDETNMVSWVKVFKRYVHGSRLWGLHNYKDTNPRKGQKMGGTRLLVRNVRGPIWLTETGGIVYFKLPSGGVLFKKSESRANKALKRMFRLAKRYRKRIKRVYVYDWAQGRKRNRFDSGLLRKDGVARPGYFTVKRTLAGSGFDP